MNSRWSLVYEKAIRQDGSLLFPERLNHEFLSAARKTMGSYIFANQYQNEIIPEGEQSFKKHWLRFYGELPERIKTFAFIDPAASQSAGSDYTALVVVSTDIDKNWFVRHAQRYKLNPTEIISLCFTVAEQYSPAVIGIENIGFQRLLVHFALEEMKRRKKYIPIAGIPLPPDKTKEMRILSLVPRFEWGTLLLAQGLHDLELELATFPRGSHDDVLDALSSINLIANYPTNERTLNADPNPNDPGYETWYRQQLLKRANSGGEQED